MPDAEPTSDTPRILLVGGVSRKAGKTSMVESILRTFPEHQWTAVKISQHGHDNRGDENLLAHGAIGGGSAGLGAGLDPANFRLWEETESNCATDTGRFLAAGAARALLLEADDSYLPDALAKLLEFLRNARAGWIICETTRAAPLFAARLFLMIAGPGARPAKASAQRMEPLADAIVVCAPAGNSAVIGGVAIQVATQKDSRNAARREGKQDNLTSAPVFRMHRGRPLPVDLRSYIERRFLK